jgi:hypothetical protein
MTIANPPEGAVELQFEPLREGWSVYKTRDEATATLSLKLVLMKIFLLEIDETGAARFSATANPIYTVSVPPEKKGPKATHAYTPEEITAAITEEDIKFDTVKEEWNDYQLPQNVILSAKLELTVVSRTKLYDAFGDPIYRIQHQSVVKSTNMAGVRTKYMQLLSKKS